MGETTVTPNSSGTAPWNVTTPQKVEGSEVKAIAFNDLGGTSQDSPDRTVTSAGPQPQTNLSIGKTNNPGSFIPGSTITYQLSVTNKGPIAAANVTVSDRLPPGTQCLRADTAWGSYYPKMGSVEFDLNTLAVGQVVNMTIEVRARSSAGELTNVANVDTYFSTPDLDPTDNRATNQLQVVAPAVVQLSASSLVLSCVGRRNLGGRSSAGGLFDRSCGDRSPPLGPPRTPRTKLINGRHRPDPTKSVDSQVQWRVVRLGLSTE